MNLTSKYIIAEKILTSKDDVLLNEVKLLMGLSESDFWGDLPPEVQLAIKKAEVEIDEGKGISHDEVMMEIRNRFNNKY